MVVRLAEKVRHESPVHPLNAQFSIVVRLAGKVIEVSSVQLVNAHLPMVVTPLGMEIWATESR